LQHEVSEVQVHVVINVYQFVIIYRIFACIYYTGLVKCNCMKPKDYGTEKSENHSIWVSSKLSVIRLTVCQINPQLSLLCAFVQNQRNLKLICCRKYINNLSFV